MELSVFDLEKGPEGFISAGADLSTEMWSEAKPSCQAAPVSLSVPDPQIPIPFHGQVTPTEPL